MNLISRKRYVTHVGKLLQRRGTGPGGLAPLSSKAGQLQSRLFAPGKLITREMRFIDDRGESFGEFL